MIEPTERLLQWYAQNKRSMPWRDVGEPYRVWVSEVMLQQTRVDTVGPYYERWMERFPSVAALAAAGQGEVLKLWEGLGYYSRARKLHEGAQAVMARFGGQLPADEAALASLPGIGPYTAAAIASFAFGIDALPVDGNLNRVLARFAGFDLVLGSKEFLAAVREVGWRLLPAGKSADYNQALMDLGSMVCTPMAPNCGNCPLADWCASKADPTARPRKAAKAAVPTRYKVALVAVQTAVQDGQVLLVRRPENGLLGGMWEFPAVEVAELNGLDTSTAAVRLAEIYAIEVKLLRVAKEVKHAYTHFRLVEQAWFGSVEQVLPGATVEWLPLDRLAGLPMGKVDRAIANGLGK